MKITFLDKLRHLYLERSLTFWYRLSHIFREIYRTAQVYLDNKVLTYCQLLEDHEHEVNPTAMRRDQELKDLVKKP